MHHKGKISRFAPSLTGDLHIGNLASLVYISSLLRPWDELIWRVDTVVDRRNFRTLKRQLRLLRWVRKQIPQRIVIRFIRTRIDFFKSELIFLLRHGHAQLIKKGDYKGCYVTKPLRGDKLLKRHVLVRSNGHLTYLLSSAIFDYRHRVNLLVRGNDLLSTWNLQREILSWFGREIELVVHHGLFLRDKKKITKKSDRDMYLDHFVDLGYSIASIVRWIVQHSKRIHSRPLTVSNISLVNKVVDPRQLETWLRKNQKQNSWEDVRAFFPDRDHRYFWFWILWRRNLENNWNLYTVVQNYQSEESFLSLTERSLLRRLLRKLTWGSERTPDFRSVISVLGNCRVKEKILRILID